MKISIIIPAYNVEKLISKCLKSVLSQDLSPEEYEVIIIDDGSTDNTYEVIKAYIKDVKNVFLFNQVNQRQGAARNNALKKARGEYIWFVDSDDYIEENSLKSLYTIAKKKDLDILFFTSYKDLKGEVREVKPKLDKIEYNKIYKGQDIIAARCINCGPCFCIYKKVFLDSNDLRFIEGVFYEDNEFMLRAYYYAKKVYYINKPYYYVVLTETSSTRTMSSTPIFDILKVMSYMFKFTQSVEENKEIQRASWYYSVMIFNTALSKMKNQDSNTHKQFIKKIKPLKNDLVKAMFNSGKTKYILEGVICFLSIKFLLRLSKN
ncbi:glycosyltransferase [Polaribacter sp. Z014]|uniref:glycosyltransferase family 2 protein n=1 Tax=Polaribacter sp. Z014 TaxID=2927126 RepID=UPI00201FC236|nr:glycosyltransferase family 2 protein [Polaribacter sp. Z014]MCL7763385.1 glycosyltransferase [Polaribacter sp. Z014]